MAKLHAHIDRTLMSLFHPVITSGNTNAPTIMIGERAAEFLLTSARSQPSVA